MREVEGRQPSVGGGEIYVCSWHPEAAPVGAVVLVHGLAEHCHRYGEFVARLVAQRWAVYALDHRGHGRSAGPRGQIGRFAWLVADVAARVAEVRAAHPGRPVLLLGHSMGGAVALACALEHPAGIAGLVLSAPALGVDPAVSRLRVGVARLLSHLAPGVGVLRLDAADVSRDSAIVAGYRADPYVFHGSIPARTAVELLEAMASFPGRVAALRMPALVLHGTADRLAPIEHAEPVWRRLGSVALTAHRYAGLAHELFNEPERAQVYADLDAWLAQRLLQR